MWKLHCRTDGRADKPFPWVRQHRWRIGETKTSYIICTVSWLTKICPSFNVASQPQSINISDVMRSTMASQISLQWRHNERDCVSNHRRLDSLSKRLFRRRSKKTSKLRFIGLCEGISLVTGEFPSQRASNAENVFIWWRYHEQPYECLLNRLSRRRSKKTSKLRVTGLWEGNSPVTGEFPAQRVSNADNISIWWRHYVNANSYITLVFMCTSIMFPWKWQICNNW